MSFEDQRHYIMILCCMGQELIVSHETSRHTSKVLREVLGLSTAELRSLKKTLVRMELIDDQWLPTGWQKRQFLQTPLEESSINHFKSRPVETIKQGVEHESAPKVHRNLHEIAPKTAHKSLNTQETVSEHDTKLHRKIHERDMKLHRKKTTSLEINELWDPITDTDTEEDIYVEKSNSRPAPRVAQEDIQRVLKHLNDRSGSSFRWKNPSGKPTAHATAVRELLKSGYTVEQLIEVVDRKADQWGVSDTMRQYLRPQTLFRRSKFEAYLDE